MASNSNDGKDMQVDEDDFMLSLSPTQGTGNGNNEVIATEVMSLPADLDVTDLENNSQLWLSLEGSLSGAQDLEAVAALSSVAHEDMGDAIVSHDGLTEDILTQSEASNLIEVETVEMAPVEDSTMDHQETVSTSNVEESAAEIPSAVEETPSTATETVIDVPEVAKVAVTPSAQQNQTYLSVQSPAAGTGGSQSGIRVVTTANVTAKGLAAIASSPSTSIQQPLRLLSPAKTITLQQAQQLGLFSPKKGQTIAISRVAVSSSGTLTTAVASSSAAVALGKQQPAKLAVGNVTLVKNPLLRTPTKIAPAPPQQLATPQQPGNLFIKNATAVTMATLVTKPGTTHLASSSPQKIVLRPATPGSTTTSPARVAVSGQPAQYIRLTTAQAVAAGILPGVSGTPTGSGQIQLGGSKIQLVRLVTPGTGTAATSTAATPGSPGVVSTATPTLKVATKTAGGTVSKVTTPVKSLVSPASATPGGQRLLLPAGSINSLGGGNLVVVPAQYVAQQQIPATSSATTPVQPLVTAASDTSATAVTPDLGKQPSAVKNLQAKLSAERSPTENNTSLNQGSNKQSALDANGIKPRKPCNCTKSQCLKLYCDCFANGEFCNGCNCVSCANNLEHEELRSRAVRACLDRNPHAFKPKIGVSWGPEPRRHNKGCHCKRSGCLKNYCECYEAKIACTAICKCIGCKNCFDSLSPSATTPEKKTAKLGVLPAFTPLPETPLPITVKIEERSDEPPSKMLAPLSAAGTRPAFSFITQEVVEATCQCLLAQVEEAEKSGKDSVAAEGMVLEEFGRCLLQIIEYASRAKGTTSP